jgi:hypothetical protein
MGLAATSALVAALQRRPTECLDRERRRSIDIELQGLIAASNAGAVVTAGWAVFAGGDKLDDGLAGRVDFRRNRMTIRLIRPDNLNRPCIRSLRTPFSDSLLAV